MSAEALATPWTACSGRFRPHCTHYRDCLETLNPEHRNKINPLCPALSLTDASPLPLLSDDKNLKSLTFFQRGRSELLLNYANTQTGRGSFYLPKCNGIRKTYAVDYKQGLLLGSFVGILEKMVL